MHRIDTPSATETNQFTNGSATFPTTLPTRCDAEWLNAVQEAICSVIEAAGITLTKGQNDQLKKALAVITGTAASATGGAATLPANPVGFITQVVDIAGVPTTVLTPYYTP